MLGAGLALGVAACAPPAYDGDDDDRQDTLGIICEGELSITGTFVASAPQPEDVFGCWPVGTWTFSASVGGHDCPSAPMVLPEYKFSVTRDAEEVEHYSYDTDPAYERVRIKVTSGGGGLCEGGVELYSEDGKHVWILKPSLQADGTLNGSGQYELYGSDQWPY